MMIIKTEVNCEPKLLEVSLDDLDGEPFLDGVWDMDGKEVELNEEDEMQVLSDAIEELWERRADHLVHMAEDWTGS